MHWSILLALSSLVPYDVEGDTVDLRVIVSDDNRLPIPAGVLQIADHEDHLAAGQVRVAGHAGEFPFLQMPASSSVEAYLHEVATTDGIALGMQRELSVPPIDPTTDETVQVSFVSQPIARTVVLESASEVSKTIAPETDPMNTWEVIIPAGTEISARLNAGWLWNADELYSFTSYMGVSDHVPHAERGFVIQSDGIDFGEKGVGVLLREFGFPYDGLSFSVFHLSEDAFSIPQAERTVRFGVPVVGGDVERHESIFALMGNLPKGYLLVTWGNATIDSPNFPSTSYLTHDAPDAAASSNPTPGSDGVGCADCDPPPPYTSEIPSLGCTGAQSWWDGIDLWLGASCPGDGTIAGTTCSDAYYIEVIEPLCDIPGTSRTYTVNLSRSVTVTGSSDGGSVGITETISVTETTTLETAGTGCGQCVTLYYVFVACETTYNNYEHTYRNGEWHGNSATQVRTGTCDRNLPFKRTCVDGYLTVRRCNRPTTGGTGG